MSTTPDVPRPGDTAAARGLVVAVDGPSGSGKSSTSRGVATRLGLAYLDTGAMYRAMTWWVLQQGVDVHDPAAVASRVDEPVISSGTDPAAPTIAVDGTDVGAEVRSEPVTRAVSPVSAVPEVRARLLRLQRQVIAEACAGPAGGIVVEGRDIGSTVAPDAAVKVYLTADAEARALRRAAEEGGSDVAVTQQILEARDRIDSGRAVSPLAMAEGAVHLDTTAHTLAEVVDQVVALVERAQQEEQDPQQAGDRAQDAGPQA
ncbi:(d)CMP kinase [Nocardioides perillae]|uniref:Cytidylate kinase n=1 Tax=Nocardioides perillae TaxID=1119534 RepID=A0A7Y9UL27_9ACTN|nr:cytidylate kinase [Nocardioides perillae]